MVLIDWERERRVLLAVLELLYTRTHRVNQTVYHSILEN